MDWYPDRTIVFLWTVLGIVLSFIGIALFALVYAVSRGSSTATVELSGLDLMLGLMIFVALVVVLLVLHEWLHGLAMSGYGAKPEYGAGVLYKVMPYFFCTAPGHKFTKQQFAVVSAAPAVMISLVGALCVALVPLGGWLVIPLGIHLAGCIGDFWFLGMISRQPQGTLIEDLRTGTRFHRPAT